jgi:hypothetical protein
MMDDPVVAEGHDGEVMWIHGACSKAAAKREVGQLWSEPRPWTSRLRAEKQHLRPVGSEESGEFRVCDADHPDAIPVWRVEGRGAPAWWWRLRIRVERIYRRREHQAVLWGGREERRVHRWERWLFRPGVVVAIGDWQLALPEQRAIYDEQRRQLQTWPRLRRAS